MRLEEAATAASASTKSDAGVFTPGQVIRASKKMEKGGRKARRIAAGEGLMQDVGTLGNQVLQDTVPNSGTTDRALMALLAASGVSGVLSPSVVAPIAAGMAAYTQPGQRALLSAIQRGAPLGSGLLPGLLGGDAAGLIRESY
jgi:hypothetical protein